jgi:adenylate cyclase
LAVSTRKTRRGSLVIAAGVIAAVAVLYLAAPQFLYLVELFLYNHQFRVRGPRPANDTVVIVAIDERSLRDIGRWPWPRSVLANLVRRLDQDGATVIALDLILSEPERSGELQAATHMKERLERAHVASPDVRRELERVIHDADHDRTLAEAIRASGRVILATDFSLATTVPNGTPIREGAPLKSALIAFKHYADRGLYPPPHANGVGLPIPPLAEAAAALGHVDMLADEDGTTRFELLAVEYKGHYYPSLALEAVRLAAGIEPPALRLDFGGAIELGPVSVPVDARTRVLIDYAGPGQTFTHLSAADVLRGQHVDRIKGRIVFVGATAEGTYDLRVTPFSPVMPGVEKHANVAANLLEGRFIARPPWVELVEASEILLFPLVIAAVLPHLRPAMSILFTAVLWAGLFGTTHVLLRRGLNLPLVYPSLAILLTFLGISVFRFLTEERQRLWLRRAFQQYVSPEVVARITDDPSALTFGGELRPVTVLFSDIRDFTTFTERHDPHEVVEMLREYLTAMSSCVLQERGTLDKYIGDAVMAIFGAPIAYPDHAARACRAAMAMTAEAERLEAKWTAEGREPFRIGIGINTGEMVVGNLGSEQLFDYTAVGDGVNVGARLESLNKEYKTPKHVIISDETYRNAQDAIEAEPLAEVVVKGRVKPVMTYALLGVRQ